MKSSLPRHSGIPLLLLATLLLVLRHGQDPEPTAPALPPAAAVPSATVDVLTKTPESGDAHAEPGPRATAVQRLADRVPGVKVDFDALRGSPHFIASTESFLTGPDGRGLALPEQRTGADRRDPHGIVKAFLDGHAAVFGHGSEVLAGAECLRDYVTQHNGLRTMVWQQQHAGIPVFQGTLQAHVTARGELVNVASLLLADPASASESGMPGAASILTELKVEARAAVQTAAAALGDVIALTDVNPRTAPAGAARRQAFDARPVLTEAGAQVVWLPQDGQSMRLCWEVISVSRRTGWMHRTLVDAGTGAVALTHSLTEAISPASYRVFTGDSPTPLSPGHATPLATQPPLAVRQLVTLSALNTTASPNGWINDGGNETLGNNVDAHLDLNADNIADTPRPQGSPARMFETPLNLTLYPSAYRNASVVNLFYWNNVMHDRLYALGFTEAAGNFQTANFGRGGQGNDAVRADGQDGLDTNNANFSTPPDGSAPRMQMFLYDGPSPERDSCLDAEVILHEYTHGLSNRLVGGGTGISALQSRGMGEGWSDFYSLSILSEPGDNPRAAFAAGGYSAYLLDPGYNTNYYYGIRRYPYCTDMQKNPLTFRDIDPGQADSHWGIPRNPITSSSAASVHNMGEVWCVTLWEARANLIGKHGAAAGNDLMLRLTTDGMKLAPVNPNFIQARDAILQAELVHSAGVNRAALWTAFAKRGMGSGASSPSASTSSGVVESVSVPDTMSVSPGTWAPVVTAGSAGEGSQTWTITNTGTASLQWTVSRGAATWLAAAPSGGTLAAGDSATVTASLTAATASLNTGAHNATLTFNNQSSGFTQTRAVFLTVHPLTSVLFAETWEAGSAGSAWTLSGSAGHRTLVTSLNGPHAGGYHLTMDAPGGAFTRNEATLTLNLAGRSNVQLSFWLKTFADEPDGPPASPFTTGADFDGVAVSANGGLTWYEVLPLRTSAPDWTKFTLNLDSAIAARGLTYGADFKIRFNHYDDSSISTDGFAFDDIQVAEFITRGLALRLPLRGTEGDAPVTATLEAVPVPSSALSVALTNTHSGEIDIPGSVVIPAGSASVTFPVTIIDDAVLDGTQSAVINAVAATYRTGEAVFPVDDNETAVLTLSLAPAAAEGGGALFGVVYVSAPVARDTPVTITSSHPAKLSPPAQTIIPAGETSASVPCNLPEDTVIDGTQSVIMTASVPNWTPGSTAVEISDNELSYLTLTLPLSVTEGLPPVNATLLASGTLTAPLTVTLTADDRLQLEVPASVTIPAGQSSVTVPVSAVDDSIADGSWAMGVLATAPGFGESGGSLIVHDNDALSFSVSTVGVTQTPGRTFALTVTALDAGQTPIAGFNSPIALRAADSSGTPVPVTPGSIGVWNNGVWTGQVKVSAAGTGIVITADDGEGHTGSTNPFDAIIGPLHHFTFSAIGPAQYYDAPFPLTIRAEDDAGNAVPGFNGTAVLAAVNSSGTVISLPFQPDAPVTFSAGIWSGAVSIPFLQDNLKLRASGTDAITGQSAVFSVTAPPAIVNSVVLSDSFDSTTPKDWWTFSGTSTWRMEIITQQSPPSGPYHLAMDSSAANSFARNEATIIVDLAGRSNVVLSYRARNINDERHYSPFTSTFTGGADYDGVAISTDGVTWSQVSGFGYSDYGYSFYSVELDAVMASLGWNYNREFRIRFNQYDDQPLPDDGIVIDDVVVSAAPGPVVTLQLPPVIIEGSSPQTGTVSLPAAAAEDTVLALSSSTPGKLTVPASVIVPAGQLSATFALTPSNDLLTDGDKTVYITATPPAGDPVRAAILVNDDEVTAFTLDMSDYEREGPGSIRGTIELPSPAYSPVTIRLTSSDPAQLTVPATVTVYAGYTYGSFYCSAVDDIYVDGPRTVIVTGTRDGIPGATASDSLIIQDNESTSISLRGSGSVNEGENTSLTAGISGPALDPITIQLTGSWGGRLTVPESATIPAGASSADFTVEAPQNSVPENPVQLQLSAQAPGFYTQYFNLRLEEDDPDHFSFDPIPQRVAGTAFPITVTARTSNGYNAARGFKGTVALSASGSAGALTVSPPVTGTFTAGVWNGSITLSPPGTSVRLRAGAPGISGLSNVFDALSAPLHHFAISAITSPQRAWEPFMVTITAQDAANNTLTGFTDPALLDFTNRSVSNYSFGISYPVPLFLASETKNRSQVLYRREDLGGVRRINAITLNCAAVPSIPLTNWTVRMKHTTRTAFTTAAWDAGPWTTVHSSTLVIPHFGNITVPFSRVFEYDGVSSVVLDFSSDLSVTGISGTAYSAEGYSRRLTAATSSATALAPTLWSGTGSATVPAGTISYWVPNITFHAGFPPFTPAVTAAFTAGKWTGPVTMEGSGNGLVFTATTGFITSYGTAFTVVPAAAGDTDGDGLPDIWENIHGFDPGSSSGHNGSDGDPDGDGLANLFEHALQLSPLVPNNDAALRSAVVLNPDDGQNYLTVTWRRRPGSPYAFALESATSPGPWTRAPGGFQEISAVANPDGSETVVTRLLPATGPAAPRRFVRVSVSVP